jgi:hypothetical protein
LSSLNLVGKRSYPRNVPNEHVFLMDELLRFTEPDECVPIATSPRVTLPGKLERIIKTLFNEEVRFVPSDRDRHRQRRLDFRIGFRAVSTALFMRYAAFIVR